MPLFPLSGHLKPLGINVSPYASDSDPLGVILCCLGDGLVPLWGWGIPRGHVGVCTVGKEEEHPTPVHPKVNSANTLDMTSVVWTSTSKHPGWPLSVAKYKPATCNSKETPFVFNTLDCRQYLTSHIFLLYMWRCKFCYLHSSIKC